MSVNNEAIKQITGAVLAWASAWSSKNMNSYLGSYAKGFKPPKNQSRGEWEEERRERIMQKIESQKVGGEAQNAIAERERRKMVSLVRGLGAAAGSGTRLRLSA